MDILADLSRDELQRYSRHLTLPEIGLRGQRKLKAARMLLVGAGGLGSPLGLYLAAAGVGKLGIVDDDVVEATNLQRQVIHGGAFLGKSKVESAAQRIADLNPNVSVATYPFRLTASNALSVIADYDVVIDGSDNFPTRFLANDACVLQGKPNVYGSVYRFEGQASVFDAARGPCYRCLFPEPPAPGTVPSCAEGGVLGILPGIVGLIQATEAIKLVTGVGEPLIGRLLIFDALEMRFATLNIVKNERCAVCGRNPTITQLQDEEDLCATPPVPVDDDNAITARTLRAKLDRGEPIEVLDVREPEELEIASLPHTREIPIGELETRMHELPKDKEIIVYCRTGGRSARAVKILREAGFKKARDLAGGMHAWIDDIDPSLTRY